MRRSRWMEGGLGACLLLLGAPLASAQESGESTPDEPKTVWEFLTGKYDADGDGEISRKEYTRDDAHWARLDKDADGKLVRSEIDVGGRGGRAGARGGRRGGGRGGARAGGGAGDQRPAPAPQEGAPAPDFKLEVLPAPLSEEEQKLRILDKKKDPKRELVQLSSFRGEKPVALIFGSYT